MAARARARKESLAARTARARSILDVLDRTYPDSRCSLDHRSPFELLVATVLSAQCTDARVNLVTPALFARGGTPKSLAALDLSEIEDLVRSTGFFHNKAKNLKGAAEAIVSRHAGEVPRTMAELVELPGVARKTANCVLGTGFGIIEGVVVDTHVHRISRLLGLTEADDPKSIEPDLMAILPKSHWLRFSHQLIDLGRATCIARRPACARCPLASLCPSAGAHRPRAG